MLVTKDCKLSAGTRQRVQVWKRFF